MKMRIWNREIRKFLVIAALLFLSVFLACNAVCRGIVREQRAAHQRMFAVLLGNIQVKYPDVREEEWIALLNDAENVEAGRELMERYGILEGRETFALQEKYIRKNFIWTDGFLLLLFLLMGALAFFYLRKRQSRLDGLATYLQRVAQGEYSLELEKQRDDELSQLQNELYKVIVLLREQAENLKAQRKALANSVADISHQLKTPLTSMMVLVDNLAESRDMPEKTRKHFLAEITAQLSGMSWLVATMLKLSRLDAGVVELARRELSAASLLGRVLEGLEQHAKWCGVELVLQVREDAILYGDEHWLGEALSNIVKNGIEHSPAQGSVKVLLQDNAVYTAISVQNFGEILSPEEQKHIFERFYKGKKKEVSTVSTKKQLTDAETGNPGYGNDSWGYAGLENVGIGLALAKEIIERQNGFISVDSTEEEGTVFTVKFMKAAPKV